MAYTNIDGITVDQFNEIIDDLGYDGNDVYYMGDFNGVYSSSAYEAIQSAFHGRRFGYPRDSFNPNDEFFAFNGYDNLISIPEHYLQDYFDQFKNEILEYVNTNEIKLDRVAEE